MTTSNIAILFLLTNEDVASKILYIIVNSALISAALSITAKRNWVNPDNCFAAISFSVITAIGISGSSLGAMYFVVFGDLSNFEKFCLISGVSVTAMILSALLIRVEKNSVKANPESDVAFLQIAQKKWGKMEIMDVDDVRVTKMQIGMSSVLEEVLKRQKIDSGLIMEFYRKRSLKRPSVVILEYKKYLESIGQKIAVDQYSRLLNNKLNECRVPGTFFTTLDSEQSGGQIPMLNGVFYCRFSGIIMIFTAVMNHEILKR